MLLSVPSPDILLSTLLPNTFNLYYSRRVREFYTHIKQGKDKSIKDSKMNGSNRPPCILICSYHLPECSLIRYSHSQVSELRHK
jgi:hypothetical protein